MNTDERSLRSLKAASHDGTKANYLALRLRAWDHIFNVWAPQFARLKRLEEVSEVNLDYYSVILVMVIRDFFTMNRKVTHGNPF